MSDPPERASSQTGTVLSERWTLGRILGRGGTAVVYEATHRNGRRAAIKVLRDRLVGDARARRRFLREGYVANKIGHDGAVQILDDGEQGEVVYLVMELLEGETLDERWAQAGKRLPLDEVLDVVDGLLEVLGAAHERAVVHRDVKPSNVFLCRDGRLKLLDFGLARLDELEGGGHTAPGSFMGTPAFMAPEQARGRWEVVDGRTDLWAVGALAFTMLAGRSVHQGETPSELFVAAASTPAPSLGSLAPDVPATIVAVIDRALAFAIDARFASASEMRGALAAARTSRPPPAARPSPSAPENETIPETVDDVARARSIVEAAPAPRSSPPRSRSALWVALALLALLAGLGAASAWWAFGGSTPPSPPVVTSGTPTTPTTPTPPTPVAQSVAVATPSVATKSAATAPSISPSSGGSPTASASKPRPTAVADPLDLRQ